MWRYVWNLRWGWMPASMSLGTPSSTRTHIQIHPPAPHYPHPSLFLLAPPLHHRSSCEQYFLLAVCRANILMEGSSSGRALFLFLAGRLPTSVCACCVLFLFYVLLHVGGSVAWLFPSHTLFRVEGRKGILFTLVKDCFGQWQQWLKNR